MKEMEEKLVCPYVEKVWLEIKEKGTHNLIRIIYNPYLKPTKDILKDWIVPEELKNVYGVRTK